MKTRKLINARLRPTTTDVRFVKVCDAYDAIKGMNEKKKL